MKFKRTLSLFMMGVMLSSSVPFNVFAEDTAINNNNLTEDTTISGSSISVSNNDIDVDFNIIGQWNGGFNGEIILTNTSDKTIENWQIQMEFPQKITNIWNATIATHKGAIYTIKNPGNNNNVNIPANGSVSFGFSGEYTDEIIEPSNVSLINNPKIANENAYSIEYQVISDWGDGFTSQIVITNNTNKPLEAWHLEFDFSDEITSLWNGQIEKEEDGKYYITNAGYNSVISANSSITIGFNGTRISENAEPSNFNLSYNNTEGNENVIIDDVDWNDPTDSDEDGIPDVYELNVYHTDPNKKDTDGDNINDFNEIFFLNTNPNQKDTDGNGINDDLEDFDNDGLNNYDELDLGTNPFIADTDEDDLLDGDEVHKYNTNPLNPDTDNDGILDSDELSLGLDPNNNSDADTQVKQIISADELYINRYNDDFQISMEVVASNSVKRFIEQDISKYSGILSNNKSIIGFPISLGYNAGTISEGKITFKLNDSLANNSKHYFKELNLGIERYGIFCYDENVNTIIPLPCEYDTANSSIILDAEYMGDLFLLDYESLMYDLGVSPEIESIESDSSEIVDADEPLMLYSTPTSLELENSYAGTELDAYEEVTVDEIESVIEDGAIIEKENLVLYSATTPKLLAAANTEIANSNSNTSSTARQVDLTLVIDTTGSMGSSIDVVKANLVDLINRLRQENISLYIAIVDYRDITCDGKNSTKLYDFSNLIDDIQANVNNLYPSGGGDTPETAIDGLGRAYNLKYRAGATKFIFLITDTYYKDDNNFGILNMEDMTEKLKAKDIITSVVTYESSYSKYRDLAHLTGGDLILMSGNFSNQMYDVIFRETPKTYILIGNNLTAGYFRIPLKHNGSQDTDGDRLTDSDEVDWDNVNLKSDGTYTLYTWEQLCNKSSKYRSSNINPVFSTLKYQKVLPVLSDPFSEDTDKDYYTDWEEAKADRLVSNPMYIFDRGLSDKDFYNGAEPTEITKDKTSDGKWALTKISQKEGVTEYQVAYNFTRRPREFVEFSLKPESRSFYRFTIDGKKCDFLDVHYFNGKLQTWVTPESDGTYLLESGIEYTIKTYGYSNSEYKFSARQDNWVYAPDGGKWEVIKNASSFSSTPYSEIYISPKLLVEATCKNLPDTEKYEIYECYTPEDIDAVIAKLTYSDPQKTSIKETFTDVCTIGGMTLVIIGLAIPGGKEAGAIYYITVYGGAATTSGGFLVWLSDKINKFENARIEEVIEEGNFSIQCSHFTHIFGNVWDPWETASYIKKIQDGNIGKITNITKDNVISYCGW